MVAIAGYLALRSDPETRSAGGISSPAQQRTASQPSTTASSSEQVVPEISETRISRGRSRIADRTVSTTTVLTQSSSNEVGGDFVDRKVFHSVNSSLSTESHNSAVSVPKLHPATQEHSVRDVSGSMPYLQLVPQPAVMFDFDDPVVSQPEAKERLEAIASDFSGNLTRSGIDVASPAYRQLWDREAAVADVRFRSMYGGHVWMNHHIQSHHAQLGSADLQSQ